MHASENKISRISFSGGGARGAGVAGAIRALIEQKIWPNVEHVTGASVGSIFAALTSCGSNLKIIQNFSKSNFKSLLGETSTTEIGSSYFSKDGNPLLEAINNALLASLKSYDQSALTLEDKDFFNQIMARNCITFAELAYLHTIDPVHFKKLSIIVTEFESGKPQICNSENTPDLNIAETVRASAALPVVLTPQDLVIDGLKSPYRDGGLYNNVPLYFDRDQNAEHGYSNYKPEETLIFVFGDSDNKKDNAHKALHGSHHGEAPIKNQKLRAIKISIYSIQLLHAQTDFDYVSFRKDLIDSIIKLKNNNEPLLTETEIKKVTSIINTIFQDNSDYQEKIEEKLIPQLEAFFLPPIYKTRRVEKIVRDKGPNFLTNSKVSYNNSHRKNLTSNTLSNDYAQRTVILNVASVGLSDFKKASERQPIMAAIAYLDTIVYLYNHDFIQFNSEQTAANFFDSFIEKFKALKKNPYVKKIDGKTPLETIDWIKNFLNKTPGTKNAKIIAKLVNDHQFPVSSIEVQNSPQPYPLESNRSDLSNSYFQVSVALKSAPFQEQLENPSSDNVAPLTPSANVNKDDKAPTKTKLFMKKLLLAELLIISLLIFITLFWVGGAGFLLTSFTSAAIITTVAIALVALLTITAFGAMHAYGSSFIERLVGLTVTSFSSASFAAIVGALIGTWLFPGVGTIALAASSAAIVGFAGLVFTSIGQIKNVSHSGWQEKIGMLIVAVALIGLSISIGSTVAFFASSVFSLICGITIGLAIAAIVAPNLFINRKIEQKVQVSVSVCHKNTTKISNDHDPAFYPKLLANPSHEIDSPSVKKGSCYS